MSRRLCPGEARPPGDFCVARIEAANKRRAWSWSRAVAVTPAPYYALYVLVKDLAGTGDVVPRPPSPHSPGVRA